MAANSNPAVEQKTWSEKILLEATNTKAILPMFGRDYHRMHRIAALMFFFILKTASRASKRCDTLNHLINRILQNDLGRNSARCLIGKAATNMATNQGKLMSKLITRNMDLTTKFNVASLALRFISKLKRNAKTSSAGITCMTNSESDKPLLILIPISNHKYKTDTDTNFSRNTD